MEYKENLEFLSKKQAELTESISGKKKVFLDMNHCIWLRNIDANGSQNTEDEKLFNRILQSAGNVIYPIEFGILSETMKQSNPQSFRQTIKIMDKLSSGISIIPHDERQFIESLWFFSYPEETKNSEFVKKYPVFTKTTMIAGTKLPVIREYGEEWNRKAQLAFLDYIWDIDLGQLMDKAAFNKDGKAADHIPRFDDSAEDINRFNQRHNSAFSSWEQLIDIETQGAVDAGKEYFKSALGYLFYRKTGKWPQEEESLTADGKGLHNFVYGMFHHGFVTTQFPFLKIAANLYASIRWNKRGKMTGNDYFDFNHATAALPYCDVFLTDKKTAFHVTNNKTRLDKVYGCKVYSSLKDIDTIL